MQMNPLGRSDVMVSALCLGSMTWGSQNSEAEAHAQIDMALAHGINFIDTAEIYPVNPMTPETQGDSERIIGSWFKSSGRRGDVVLATKVAGGWVSAFARWGADYFGCYCRGGGNVAGVASDRLY